MLKRILSLVLVLTMLAGYMPPVHVHAGENTEVPVAEETMAATEETDATEETSAPTEQPEPVTEAAIEPTQPAVPEETAASTEVTVPATEFVEETVAPTEGTDPTEVVVTDEAALAATIVASGTCGDNLTWKLDDEGTLTISGTGDMNNYFIGLGEEQAPWYGIRDKIIKVVIGSGATSVGDAAFYACENLTEVTMPSSISKICFAAFMQCTSLKSITIPASVTRIEQWVFESCSSLSGFTVQEGNAAFSAVDGVLMNAEQTKLIAYPNACEGREYDIPDGIEKIGNRTFSNCDSLISIHIPESVNNIEFETFYNMNNLQHVFYSGTKEQWGKISVSFGNDALMDAKYHYEEDRLQLTNYSKATCTIKGVYKCDICADILYDRNAPATHQYSNGACKLCGAPEGMEYSLENNQITITKYTGTASTLNIPATIEGYPVVRIEECAFFDNNRLTSVTIPDSVTYIGDSAFMMCENLSNVTIPNGVISIGQAAFWSSGIAEFIVPKNVSSIGEDAFSCCDKLTMFTVDAANASFSAVDGVLMDRNQKTIVTYPAGRQASAYNIPSGVTTIGVNAFFRCTNLTRVNIPESVTTIEDMAFNQCYGLTGITIPASVTSIGNSAFHLCGSNTGFTVKQGNTSFSAVDGVLMNADQTTIIAYPHAKASETYDVPDGVTTIGYEAFSMCPNITGITFPDTLTTIKEGAFVNVGWDSLTIPASVSIIEDCAFAGVYTKPKEVYFEGNAPQFVDNPDLGYGGVLEESAAFGGIELTAYYPAGNPTWTSDVMQDYGGEITWIPYDPETGEEPKEYHNTLDELTEVDYLAFAQIAYLDFKSNDTVKKALTDMGYWGYMWDADQNITYGELCEHISKWRIDRSLILNLSYFNGFYAVPFTNDKGEVVLAYRGSVPPDKMFSNGMLSFQDFYCDWLMNDLPIELANKLGPQYQSALLVYKAISKQYGKNNMVVTGHSLGGAWADVVSAYSGCKGVTFNAVSVLDAAYSKEPIDMGRHFSGVDKWNFVDHANMYDGYAGAFEAHWSLNEIKPFVAHKTRYGANALDIRNHFLDSMVKRNLSGDLLSLGQLQMTDVSSIDSFSPHNVVSNHLSFTLNSIDLGTSRGDVINNASESAWARKSFGGDGADTITGGGLPDTLIGGRGYDTLDGSWSDDTYVYFKGDDWDYIYDLAGSDKLYLYDFDESDVIIAEVSSFGDTIDIKCNGDRIVSIYRNNREYALVSLFNRFTVHVGETSMDITNMFKTVNYKSRVWIACPVSIEILDADGIVVYTLEDGAVGAYYTDYGNFYVFEEEDGGYGKVLDLVEGYTARIVGEDTGTMAIEYRDVEDGELAGPKSFADVPVSTQFTATFEETSEGELVLAADTDGDNVVDTKIGYDGKPVPVEVVDLTQEYIALQPEETFQLQADVKPAELSQFLSWSVEKGGEDIIDVAQDGTVTGRSVGTAYVLVTVKNGDATITERCRIDVAQTESAADPIEPDEAPVGKVIIESVQLSTNKVTTELYKNEFATFEILLDLPQNHPYDENEMVISDDAVMAVAGLDKKSNLVDSVKFATINDLFTLEMLDDRTVQIIPTRKAMDNGKTLKSSYTDTVIVTVQGVEYPITEKLTLSVKKTSPKLKATVGTFNSFYAEQAQEIIITGGTATKISLNEAKETPIPEWLEFNTVTGEDESFEKATLRLKRQEPETSALKSVSGKVYVEVWTAEWRIPVTMTLSVKNSYKAPGLKLSATTVGATTQQNSNGVSLKLLCTNKKNTLEGLNVERITAPEGYTIAEELNLEDGSFTLKAMEGFKEDKITLQVHFSDTTVTLPLKLTIKTATVKLKLAPSSVTLNTLTGDKKFIGITATPADYVLKADNTEITGVDGVTITEEDGGFWVETNDQTAAGKTYKITVKSGNSKAVTLTVKTVGKNPTMNAPKVKGTMDVNFPGNKATVGVTLKDYADAFAPTLTIKDSKGNDVTNQFKISDWNGTEFAVTPNGAVKGTYTATVTVKLDMGEEEITLTKTAKLTVKETLPKVKLSATKVTLNKKLDHAAVIDVTSATKGYELEHGRVEITAPEQIEAVYVDGKLQISLNESAAYGKTYKVTIRAYKGASAATLSISVPAEKKSNVSAAIKAGGSIDVIREGTAITITPTFTNAFASDMETMSLKFYKRSGKIWTDVTEEAPFNVAEEDGKYIVTAKEGLTHTDKYQAELVATVGGKEITSKRINLSVKMGSAKLTIKSSDTTLFAKDRNDRAQVWFEVADLTLNGVESIEIKDAKYKDAFKIIDNRDGTFSIGFKDGKIHKNVANLLKKKASATITLNLNVFMEGNESTKANTTAKVKLTIVK